MIITIQKTFNLEAEIEKFFSSNNDNAKRITLRQYNKELVKAVVRIENGNFVKH